MSELILPSEKSKPKINLKEYIILLYGRAKVGKTTLAAQFDSPLFLMFEPGGRSLELYQIQMKSWKTFKNSIKALEEKPKEFKTVVLDTIDSAYEMCMHYVCAEMGIDHPQDEGYGKGWSAVDKEFSNTMSKLGMLNRGVILISHTKDKDIEQPDGTIKEMTGPSIANQGMKWVDRNCDLFAYYYYGKNNMRYLRVKGTDNIVSGNRIENHFIGISKIWAGKSAKETYENFVAAFNNKKVEEK